MEPSDVLVIGEALVDIVPSGGETVRHPGGGPANVALGLARRGFRTELLTSLGADPLGDLVTEHLNASGVHVLPESFGAFPTSTATVVLDEAGKADYVFELNWDIPIIPLSPLPRVVHAGSIAAFLQPGADAVLSLLAKAAGGGAYVTFDPNIRSMIIGPREQEIGRFEQLAALASLVKMSDEDAAWLYPGLSPEAVLGRVLELGADAGAITLGGDGAVLALRSGSAGAPELVRVPPVRVDVVDTIGAGDTFMASLIASAVSDGPALTSEALAATGLAAARAAAITVSRAGADLPWAHEL